MEGRMNQAAASPKLGIGLIWGWWAMTLVWWAFAFWPTGVGSPEWLSRAQGVCFGRHGLGLPEAQGWLLLVGAPMSFLFSMGFAYGDDIALAWKSRATKNSYRYGFLILLIFTLAAGHFFGKQITRLRRTVELQDLAFTSDRLPKEYPRLNEVAPAFKLINQRGEVVTLESLKGKPTVLTFVFAHCTTMCPMLIDKIKSVELTVGSDRANFVMITLDPRRDTPQSLPALASTWKLSQKTQLLGGSVTDVEMTLSRFKVKFERDEKTGDVAHPGLMYLIAPNGKLAYAFNQPQNAWIIDAIESLEKI